MQQFEGLRIEIEVDGENLTEDDRIYLQESVGRSAVFNLLSLAQRGAPRVEIASRG